MGQSLLARSSELAILRDAFSRAREGRGGLVLVRGEAGIGKTSLVTSISDDASKEGAEVVSGRAWELAESPPYFPLWECFRSIGVERATETDAFRLWDDALELLAARAAKQTVVWILDDLHAADLLTLDLLTFLARPVRALGVLIVATARDKDPRVSSRTAERLLRMSRDGTEIQLGPLPADAVAELMKRVSGRSSGELSEQLLARTEGNPLYVVECARMLRNAPPGSLMPTRQLPATVRQLVLERVAPMPERTCAVLQAGAILGREFSSGRASKLLNDLPANVIESLRPASEAGIVNELAPGRFSFTHILVRDAIEETVEANHAVELHARAEKVLAKEGDGADTLVERARHALAAMRDETAALTLATTAAKKSESEGAFDRALAMYERIDDARARGHLSPPTPAEQLHRAELLQAVGRHTEAESLCDAIAKEAKNAMDRAMLARAALRRGADLRPAQVSSGLVALLQSSLADPPEDARLEILVRARLAAALQPAPDPRGPIDLARRAVTEARGLSDEALLVDVLHWAGAAFVDYAPIQERIVLNEELLRKAEHLGEKAVALRAQIRLTLDRIECGDLDEWERDVERVRSLSFELGHPRHRWRALLFESMWCLARGDTTGSDRAIVELRELSGLSDDPALTLCLNAHLGQMARTLHRDDDMIRMSVELEKAGALSVPRIREISAILRFAMAAQLEDFSAMDRLASPAQTALQKLDVVIDDYESEAGFFTLMVASGLAHVGDSDTCLRFRKKLAQGPKRHIVGGHVPLTYEGPIDRVIGLLDARRGDLESSERCLRGALEEMARLQLTTWVAQIEYDLGCVLARAGRTSEADALFDSSARAANDIGMPGLATRASARRTQASAKPPPHENTDAPSRFAMTREGDVWLVRFDARDVRVKDSRGMQLLARLVERSGEDIHVLALGSDDSGRSLHESPADPIIDSQSRAEYKERLADLAQELENAVRANDRGRVERIEHEKAAIESELLAAAGIGGRTRTTGSAAERARVNVQRRLKDAVAKISEHDSRVGAFLEKAVKTGTYCRFGL